MFFLIMLLLISKTACYEDDIDTHSEHTSNAQYIGPAGYRYTNTPKIVISEHQLRDYGSAREDNAPQSHHLEKSLYHHPLQAVNVHPVISDNSLLTALLLSAILGATPVKHHGINHSEHLPVNPYLTLLLSQYGHYLPARSLGTKGLYYYAASNNYHNNKPFGSYKVHETAR